MINHGNEHLKIMYICITESLCYTTEINNIVNQLHQAEFTEGVCL